MSLLEETYSVKSIYGNNLFSNSVMQERLPQKIFERIRSVQSGNAALTPDCPG